MFNSYFFPYIPTLMQCISERNKYSSVHKYVSLHTLTLLHRYSDGMHHHCDMTRENRRRISSLTNFPWYEVITV